MDIIQMENTVAKLKTDFAIMVELIHTIQVIKVSTHLILGRFKGIYDEIIQMNISKKHFLVCLEAMHFQYKVFVTEQENLTKMLLMLLNRTYRDYYNYYNTILKDLTRYEIAQPNVAKQHLVYKDTEPFAEYQSDDIVLVFDNMATLISSIISKYNENESIIGQYKVRSTTGIFIGNLINTLEYDNSVLENHSQLFLKSIDFSIQTQNTYLSKLLKRFETMIADINADISFQESPWDNSSMSVSDQLVQKTDDGYPMVSQWANKDDATKDDEAKDDATKDDEAKDDDDIIGITIDEIKDA
jgi:hypothetical protein